jgi:hypothetical protein
VVAFARAARLDAIAITDHDTLAGVDAAVGAAVGTGLRVIPGVELTAEWDGIEVHLLGYFPHHPPTPAFDSRLQELCTRRRERFREFIRHIRDAGHSLDDGLVTALESATASLGRRHITSLLVRTGIARNRREAWGRFVAPLGAKVIPKLRVPFAEATDLIRTEGGVSMLAHPPADFSETDILRMKEAGLNGVEVKFPAAGVGRTLALSTIAKRLALLVGGGSDCHGPDGRPVGAIGVTTAELGEVCGGAAGEGVP